MNISFTCFGNTSIKIAAGSFGWYNFFIEGLTPEGKFQTPPRKTTEGDRV